MEYPSDLLSQSVFQTFQHYRIEASAKTYFDLLLTSRLVLC